MLIDNIHFLREHYPDIRNIILQNEEQLKEAPLEVVESKIGLPTIQVTVNNRPLFIHSKYDPIKEAERLLKQYENEMDEYEHIFFYGLGLGYHVESFLKKYPDKTFTLYEPQPAIFYQYMNHRNLTTLPIKKLSKLFVEWNTELGSQIIEQFAFNIKDKVLLVAHPAYIRAFPSKYEQFTSEFKNKVQKKGMSHAATAVFSKRWVLNSLMNLKTTMETPNLLIDKKDVFKGKPVLLVSAGPSLADEYENLRYIKENGLAYIFAVGSANRALVANEILPDAVLTYDPQAHNYKVFEPMLEKGIDSVPMIYGTSVGYETLEYYKGPKLHVITSQDTITPYFAKDTVKKSHILDDAFSIAIVTLQLLTKMHVGSIILVGQNFAFRDNLFYSKDIKRGNKSAEVQEKDLVKSLYVDDVYGNQVKTNQSFNQMRLAMEQYIENAGDMEIINTTKGGAAIKGAPFQPLEEIIQTKLQAKVVEENWYFSDGNESNFDGGKKENFLKEMEQFTATYDRLLKLFREMTKFVDKKNVRKIEDCFVKFDKQFHAFINNHFYLTIIQPINQAHFERLQNDISKLNKMQNVVEKAKQLINAAGSYIQVTCQTYNEFSPFVSEVLSKTGENWLRYKSDCGVFSYSEEWKKEVLKIEEQKANTTLAYHYADKTGAKIKFNFYGKSIKLLAGTRKDFATKVEINLDGVAEMISTKSNRSTDFVFETSQLVYEKSNLENKIHEIEITILEDKTFVFQGVQIEHDGRLYHIDEVTSVDELEVGKRIRCHYKATYNQVGEFSGLGEATKEFIPPESSAYPDGDFYFIMVDENDEEGKKLIADRNVQHSISWVVLSDANVSSNRGKEFSLTINSKLKTTVRLLTGGISSKDKNNEWDKFVKREREIWNWEYKYSWVLSSLNNSKDILIKRGKFKIDTWYKHEHSKDYWKYYGGFRPLIQIKF